MESRTYLIGLKEIDSRKAIKQIILFTAANVHYLIIGC